MILAAIIMLVVSASDPEWQWIWATPDYVRPTSSRTWSSETGTARVSFQGAHFTAHLENKNQNPAYDLAGDVRGTQVTATAKPTDSDALARRCSGVIARDKTSERIDLLCSDGEFIGLIRDAPSN